MTAERYLIDGDGTVVLAYLAVRELGIREGRFGPSPHHFSLSFETAAGEWLGAVAVPTGRTIEEYPEEELRFHLRFVRDPAPNE